MVVRRLVKSYRVVLWVGFGGLLGIILLNAWKGAQVLSAIESRGIGVRSEYQRRDDLLDGIRFALSDSASEVRDYLLERDPAGVRRRRRELETLHATILDATAEYGKDLMPGEAPLWRQLEAGIDAYWSVLEPAFHWDAFTRREQAENFLQQQVIPRQGELLRLAGTVNQVNQRNVLRSRQKTVELFGQFRGELALFALGAMLLGVVLAYLTIHRILVLERASDVQLREVIRARSELQRLSRRLVAVQEEERRRVARELHDQVGQAISAVLVELGRLDSRLPRDQSESRTILAGARQVADQAVAKVRDMALLLRPSMLDDLGLVPALNWQAREVSRRTGVKVRVTAATVADDLPDEYRTCIYRTVQEAVNNAATHAHAAAVRVEARQEDGQIHVSIQDDGAGFDPSLEKGMGILGMEERVRQLGGIFRIDSHKGRGTVVSLHLPLPQPVGASLT